MRALIIAATSERYYFSPFIRPCLDLGIQLLLLDAGRIPSQASLSLRLCNSGGLHGAIDVLEVGELSDMERRVGIQEFDVAWHLRPPGLPPLSSIEDVESRFRANESRAAVQSFLSLLPCRWINKKDISDPLLSNKAYQQFVAQGCGLRVPETLVSNDFEELRLFCADKEHVLVKSLGYISLDDDNEYHLYSQLIPTPEIRSSKAAIEGCPIFAQEYIQKKYEYRVMAIGNEVLACRIDSQASSETRIDWRHYDFENVEHTQAKLPDNVEKQILMFMRAVGLDYGAIDLIETPDGDFVFLEVNPAGQWGWIADLAGLPIPTAVANMLRAAVG